MRRTLSLSSRIFVGFLTLAVVVTVSGSLAVQALSAARRDLVVLTRGYLALGRVATQVRTLQEVHDANIARAVTETDPARRRALSGFARELYPRGMRDHLDELSGLSRQMQQAGVAPGDALFLESVFAQAKRAQALSRVYDDATVAVLDVLDDEDGLDAAGIALDGEGAVESWRRRSDLASRELRTIALGVDARAADAVLRVERAEAVSIRLVVGGTAAALLLAALIFWMMVRALRPLRDLSAATRALSAGEPAEIVEAALAIRGRADADIAMLADELVGLARSLQERGDVLASRTEELRRLSTFAENVIRSVRVGIIVVDVEGHVRTINPAARSVFSLPLKDIEGAALGDVAEAFGAALPLLTEVRDSGAMRVLPLLKVQDKIVDVTVVPLRDRAGGRGSEVLLLGEDVTAREDAREKLVHSERLAAIGRLAAQITHEIRNPLSSIGLNIELLGDDVENLPVERRTEVASILDAVLAEVHRLSEITEGYLRFARLPTAHKQHKDVGDLCADLVAFFASEAAARGVNVELHVEPSLPGVAIDGDRLRQALLNLLRNGADAASNGGTVRISVSRSVVSEVVDHDGVSVVVEDNGPGIPADVRDRLFSPFFTTKKDGTGLGLVVAREIAREHGGDIAVTTSSLGGAAFVIELPTG